MKTIITSDKANQPYGYPQLDANGNLGYKKYVALLTQNGASAPTNLNFDDEPGGPNLTIGVTYEITSNTASPDFTNVGAPNNDVGTKFVATGTTPNSWGEATLLYDGAVPVTTVLENTIGNVWFTFGSNGVYIINSSNLFTTDKTFVMFGGTYYEPNTFDTIVGYGIRSTSLPNNIYINSVVVNGDSNDNDILNKASIEIRVYN